MSESKCAGMWRHRSVAPSKDGCYHFRSLDEYLIGTTWFEGGGWTEQHPKHSFMWLDESPEAITEARRESLVIEVCEMSLKYMKSCAELNDGLAKMREQREVVLSHARNAAISIKQGFGQDKQMAYLQGLIDFIADCENGLSNNAVKDDWKKLMEKTHVDKSK